MAFTFAQTNETNQVGAEDLSISINPTSAIITANLEAGEAAAGTIAVENTGAVPAQLYLTADWGPSAGSTDREATLIANALAISVTVSSDAEAIADTTVFTGRFIDLIDVSIFSSLDVGNVADVKISVAMPADRAGPTLLNKGVSSDFVFVAISTT